MAAAQGMVAKLRGRLESLKTVILTGAGAEAASLTGDLSFDGSAAFDLRGYPEIAPAPPQSMPLPPLRGVPPVPNPGPSVKPAAPQVSPRRGGRPRHTADNGLHLLGWFSPSPLEGEGGEGCAADRAG